MAFLHEANWPRKPARSVSRLLRLLTGSVLVLGLAHPGALADEIVETPARPRTTPTPQPAPEPTADPTPKPVPEVRLRGEVVETACFVIGNRTGEVHRQCAIASARAGQQLGIVDEKTKKLYVAVVDRRVEGAENLLLPYIAHRVEAYGVPLEYGDLPALTITKVRSLRPPR